MAVETIDQATGETVPLRTPFNYDRDAVSLATGLACGDPTRAQQNFKEETDINTIVRRFGLTGQLPDNVRVPTYGDFDQVNDFQTALNAVHQAEDAFMALPAALRAEFQNDPQQLLEFVANPDNRSKAVKLGLIPEPPPKGPEPALPASNADPKVPPPQGDPKTA